MRPDLLITVKNDQRLIFGWAIYDWANSAYATTVSALLPAFFAGVVVPEDGYRLWGRLYEAQTLWGYPVGRWPSGSRHHHVRDDRPGLCQGLRARIPGGPEGEVA